MSVVLPCYNVAPYIEDCLTSLLRQEDMDAEEYELLCVNDGSTDDTEQKLRAFSSAHANVRLITTENRGVSAARNTGIEHAVGQYITFVDPDDAVPADLFCHVRALLQTHADTDVLAGCFQSFADADFDRRCEVVCDYTHCERIDDSDRLRRSGVRDIANGIIQSACFAQFISRRLLCEHGVRFREGLQIGEDEVFVFEMKAVARTMLYVPTPVYFYRLREGSVMRSSSCALAKKRQTSNKRKALIYKDMCDTDDLAKEHYIAAVNQTCFMLLFIGDRAYVKQARRELSSLQLYPPKDIAQSCLQVPPKSVKLYILDRLKRMLKYPKLFWLVWFVYGFRRR